MKTCNICNTEKNFNSFRKDTAAKDGLQNVCKQCRKDQYREKLDYIPIKDLSIKDRLLLNRKIDEETGCWEWTAGCNNSGYGHINLTINGEYKTKRVHIISYEEYRGPTEGKFVLHECDNPPCFNPDHLKLGTQQDNIKDKVKKGRQSSKLTKYSVIKIRRLLNENKYTQQEIANRFKVSKPTISLIKNNKIWRHVI